MCLPLSQGQELKATPKEMPEAGESEALPGTTGTGDQSPQPLIGLAAFYLGGSDVPLCETCFSAHSG